METAAKWDIIRNKATHEIRLVVETVDGELCILDDTYPPAGKLRSLKSYSSETWEVVGSKRDLMEVNDE